MYSTPEALERKVIVSQNRGIISQTPKILIMLTPTRHKGTPKFRKPPRFFPAPVPETHAPFGAAHKLTPSTALNELMNRPKTDLP